MRITGTKLRRDGLVLLSLGAIVVVQLVSYLLIGPNQSTFKDFEPGYFAARTLVEHHDPYSGSQVLRVYRAEGGEYNHRSDLDREISTRYVYPPTSFVVVVPFALLPWASARVLWMIVSSGGLLFAALLAWDLAADFAPVLSGALVGFLLANCLVITVLCNPSGVVISLCVIAVWCFVRNRFVIAGVLCLALSLAIKPQISGLAWLYFLLAGGVHGRRALKSLLAMAVLGTPIVVWVWRVAPRWVQELHANVLFFSGHGGMFDPGPASPIPNAFVNFQVILSCFRDDPRFYTPVTYLICGLLLLVWMYMTLRSQFTPKGGWLALAAAVPLSMLPMHHHLYDTKLILLAVPATAILWVEGGRMKWISLLVSAAAIAFTGDISQTLYTRLMDRLLPSASGTVDHGLRAALVFPVPLFLLATTIFYLCIYCRYTLRAASEAVRGPHQAPAASTAPETPVHG